MVVLGASRGVGREIVQRASEEGAQVLAVARQEGDLAALAMSTPGVDTLQLDAANEGAPAKVFRNGQPDLLVICGGAILPVGSMSELTWAEFSVNWEVDAKYDLCVLPRGAAGPACSRLGSSNHFQWGWHQRLADLGQLCGCQTHADVYRQILSGRSIAVSSASAS